MQRRELFSSLGSVFGEPQELKSQDNILRPPYNINPELFTQECKNCDAKCVSVCEENIIFISQDKTPFLSFEKTGCTFCEECAKACDFGVLDLIHEAVIQTQIGILSNACLSWESVMCFSCKDPCLDNAIIFDGLFKPIIDDEKCTSCGFCISRCPVNAIKIV